MTRSTLQPLRSRRYLPAFGQNSTVAAATPATVDSETRRAVAAIGLVWLAAAHSFSSSVPAGRRRPPALAA